MGVGFGRSSLDVTLAGLRFCFGDVPPVLLSSGTLGLSGGGGGPAESAPIPVIVGKGVPEFTSICGASSVGIPFCTGAGGPGANDGGRKRRVGCPCTALRRSNPRMVLALLGSF